MVIPSSRLWLVILISCGLCRCRWVDPFGANLVCRAGRPNLSPRKLPKIALMRLAQRPFRSDPAAALATRIGGKHPSRLCLAGPTCVVYAIPGHPTS
jgi:hypothetical protein